MSETQVSMTIEPEPHGYGQHMITVERGNADMVQCMILTHREMDRLRCLMDMYYEGREHDEFTDSTGRTAAAEGSQA